MVSPAPEAPRTPPTPRRHRGRSQRPVAGGVIRPTPLWRDGGTSRRAGRRPPSQQRSRRQPAGRAGPMWLLGTGIRQPGGGDASAQRQGADSGSGGAGDECTTATRIGHGQAAAPGPESEPMGPAAPQRAAPRLTARGLVDHLEAPPVWVVMGPGASPGLRRGERKVWRARRQVRYGVDQSWTPWAVRVWAPERVRAWGRTPERVRAGSGSGSGGGRVHVGRRGRCLDRSRGGWRLGGRRR